MTAKVAYMGAGAGEDEFKALRLSSGEAQDGAWVKREDSEGAVGDGITDDAGRASDGPDMGIMSGWFPVNESAFGGS